MNIKLFEIRDKGTFVLALAIDMNPAPGTGELQFLRRCGYPCDGSPNILLTKLDGAGWASNDPYYWNGRTFPVAHQEIIAHWNDLESGSLIDVEYILGETTTRKASEL